MVDLAGPFCGDGLEEPDPAALFIPAICFTSTLACVWPLGPHTSLKEAETWN